MHDWMHDHYDFSTQGWEVVFQFSKGRGSLFQKFRLFGGRNLWTAPIGTKKKQSPFSNMETFTLLHTFLFIFQKFLNNTKLMIHLRNYVSLAIIYIMVPIFVLSINSNTAFFSSKVRKNMIDDIEMQISWKDVSLYEVNTYKISSYYLCSPFIHIFWEAIML